jgi:outer membrane protein assembly factor BamA
MLEDKAIQTYFQSGIEFAGNTLSLLSSDAPEGERNTFLGIAYAQYARTTADLRFYTNTGNYNQLVFRILAAVGIPYGNSNILPYRKQFYIGGSTSVRAFRYRSVGPGTYLPDSIDNNLFFDQTGDIKLESNLEYRFNIYKLLKGALFLDAGNIWLVNEDPSKPGGKFVFSDILSEMAVGTGFGIRLDASFFVLRLDLGMPLRKPFLPDNDRWVTDEINLKSPSWRRDNLVLNIAIGYPV